MKKIIYLFLSILLFIGFNSVNPVNAASEVNSDTNPFEVNELLLNDNLEGYKFVQFAEPLEVNYDGTTEVLLGYYEPNLVSKIGVVTPMDNYREYDRWLVYDQGITQSWSYLSNPYFIKSIARGMTYEKSEEVSATISGTFSAEIPSSSLPSVKSTFGLNSSGSKKVTQKITLSGPDAGYSSRDFYYKKGRHTHKVKIVQEHRSNWDGVLWTKTYYGSVGKPAIKHYSVDVK